ncbi:MAG: hypothetical protein KJ600_00365 [Nanoarchaeota archaeon]|nr:hypothetical protein [Nanoarchaeota archaeon]MBU1102998.1 hypothetical protein [Nanoarchaeota archaeon]
MKNKRAQFFLVAAVVIVAIIIGIAAVYTNAEVPPEDTTVYDLSKEINYEAGAVIDSGIFNSIDETDRNANIENLTDYYARTNIGTDLIVVYGDMAEIFVVFYTTSSTGSVGIGLGSSAPTDYITTDRKFNSTFVPGEGEETITIIISEDIQHTFKIKPGQTFFIILKKQRQGEQYVSASEPDQ